MSKQFFKTRKEINDWLDDFDVVNYTIKKDLTVDVNGDVMISGSGLSFLPIQFGVVTGEFECCENFLESLRGVAPQMRFVQMRQQCA